MKNKNFLTQICTIPITREIYTLYAPNVNTRNRVHCSTTTSTMSSTITRLYCTQLFWNRISMLHNITPAYSNTTLITIDNAGKSFSLSQSVVRWVLVCWGLQLLLLKLWLVSILLSDGGKDSGASWENLKGIPTWATTVLSFPLEPFWDCYNNFEVTSEHSIVL